MTFTELENALIAKGIRAEALAINKTPIDGQYCIQFDGEATEVFRFERGTKWSLATFRDLPAAMEHFQSVVLADQSVYACWDGRVK